MAEVDLRPAKLDYRIRRGDDFADTVTISEGTPSAPVNVTARTYTAQVRRSAASDVVEATMTISMTSAATGVVGYSIAASVTAGMSGTYVWDLQQASPSVRTLLAGTFSVEADVTRAA